MDRLALSVVIDGILTGIGRKIPGHRRRWRPTQPSSVGASCGVSVLGALVLIVLVLYALSARTGWLFLLSVAPAFAGWIASIVLVLRAVPSWRSRPS